MVVRMSPLRFITVVFVTLTLHSSCFVRGEDAFPGTPCPTGDKGTECASATTGLDCIGTDETDRTCQCPATKHFHYVTNNCLYSVTKSCTGSFPKDVTPNAVCDKNVVTCTAPNYQTPNFGCALSIGGTCTKPEKCDQENFVQCPATGPKRCACLEGSSQVPGTEECRLDYGSECIVDTGAPGPPVQKCPDDSNCEQKEATSTYRCSGCPPGLTQNPDGNCVVSYGEECTLEPDLTRPCDETAFMECGSQSPNVCQCKNPGSTW